jgi:ribosome maturation factor RimP
VAINIDLNELSRVIEDIIQNLDLRLYDLEFNSVSRILRVYIDRNRGGITIQDCQRTSNAISRALDNSDLINFPYTLEVSSPGIERMLKKPKHYAWAIGNIVEIDTGAERIKGFLRGTRENGIVVAVDVNEKLIPYDSIKKARVIEEKSHDKRD